MSRRNKWASPEPVEPLLTLEELADFLGVPVRTIYAWRYRGEGPPAFKVGRHLRYDLNAVRLWLAKQS